MDLEFPVKKHVLVLGGTNFMGKDLLEKLSKDPTLDVHCINRQKLHWYENWPNLMI